MAGTFITRQNEAQFGVPGDTTGRNQFYAKLNSGQTLNGKTWTHTGQGWEVSDGAPAAPANPGSNTPQPNGQLQPSPVPQIPIGPAGSSGPANGITTTQPNGQVRVTGGPDTAAGTPDPNAQLQAMLRQTLIGQLGTNVNSASVSDADLAPQAQAYEQGVQRTLASRRAETAQQASREGGGGWVEGRLDRNAQEGAQAVGAFNADLVGRKLEGRRAQLQSALQAAQQLGMAQEANDLQRQITNLNAQLTGRGQDIQVQLGSLDANTKTSLAQLDAQLQREGYSTQERIARMDAELRRHGIDTQGDLGRTQNALQLLSLQMNNQQFNDRLGFDIGTTQAGLNRDALLAGLNG